MQQQQQQTIQKTIEIQSEVNHVPGQSGIEDKPVMILWYILYLVKASII